MPCFIEDSNIGVVDHLDAIGAIGDDHKAIIVRDVSRSG